MEIAIMKTRAIRVFAGVLAATYSFAALADCNDVRANCARNYDLDSKACERNYSGQQQAACHARAAQQMVNCVKSSGC
jgi:hypothetical protein